MGDQPTQRRLAAILAADVAGYTRLMEQDTDGTVAAWQAARQEVIKPAVGDHSGKIVKLTGDGFLVEFSTVQDAVNCAIAMQRGMASSSLDFRMGVDLGDIVDDGEDIHGEGVNVAARLEGLADPGGICISGDVYNQVRNRVDAVFEDMGQQEVKNVSAPVQAYAVRFDGSAAPSASAAMAISDKPSIAVLPFDNMSGDPEQEFFTDGLTEDIITQLSRFKDLFVISRNSTFTYKGKAAKAQDVAQDLGVRYVIEGSVRKAGERIRVTVQLIDATDDHHVWAERYDRKLEDIFSIQDEITAAITATLPGRIEADSHDRARRKPTDNMMAYECVLAGKVLHHRSNREDNAEALRLLERAIELDPGYAHARAWRGCVLGQARIYGWCDDPDATHQEIADELDRALALDENDPDIHRILAAIYITRKNFDQALLHQEMALSLNPNYDLTVVQRGELMTWLGRAEEGIEWIRKAMRLNPYHPLRFWSHLGRAYFVARRYEDAVEAFKHIDAPDQLHHSFLAACYAYLGEDKQAAAHMHELMQRDPDFSVEDFMVTQHYLNKRDRRHHSDGLRKAGEIRGQLT